MAHKPKEDAERIIVALPRGLLDRVNDYRFAARHLSRAATVRALIEIGLQEVEHPHKNRSSKPPKI